MKEIKWHIGLALSLASSFLLLFSFPMYNVHILGFIALVPIFFIAYSLNGKKMAIYGIVSGFLFYSLYLFWMNAYLAVVGVGFVTIVYGGYFVITLIFVNLAARAFGAYRVILTPFIWIGMEYIRIHTARLFKVYTDRGYRRRASRILYYCIFQRKYS